VFVEGRLVEQLSAVQRPKRGEPGFKGLSIFEKFDEGGFRRGVATFTQQALRNPAMPDIRVAQQLDEFAGAGFGQIHVARGAARHFGALLPPV
jgi:hypothetical protein